LVARRVGVLSLQGDVGEHVSVLESLDVEVLKVRTPQQLASVDALVVPGGESTTIAHLLVTSGLQDELGASINDGLPVSAFAAAMAASIPAKSLPSATRCTCQ